MNNHSINRRSFLKGATSLVYPSHPELALPGSRSPEWICCFLHIGYDEEMASHQKGFQCVRTDEVWWHDLLFFVKTVEEAGMRPWMWSDYGWHHADFVEKCPKSVLQSNWYYDEKMEGFDLASMKPDAESRPYLELYAKLDRAGIDQISGL